MSTTAVSERNHLKALVFFKDCQPELCGHSASGRGNYDVHPGPIVLVAKYHPVLLVYLRHVTFELL